MRGTQLKFHTLIVMALAVVILTPLLELLEDFVRIPELDELLLGVFFLLGLSVPFRESVAALLKVTLIKSGEVLLLPPNFGVALPVCEVDGPPHKEPLAILCDLRI